MKNDKKNILKKYTGKGGPLTDSLKSMGQSIGKIAGAGIAGYHKAMADNQANDKATGNSDITSPLLNFGKSALYGGEQAAITAGKMMSPKK
jgi:hypothetical protein